MKRVLVEFVAWGRKYEWAYAKNDTSVVEWLLYISNNHEVKITLLAGFSADQIMTLTDKECFLITENYTLPKVVVKRSYRPEVV